MITTDKVISDNNWHSIEIKIEQATNNPKQGLWSIKIDAGSRDVSSTNLRNVGNGWETFLQNNAILVGGIPQYLLNTLGSPIASTTGYLGKGVNGETCCFLKLLNKWI